MKASLAIKVQLSIGVVILVGLIAMAFGQKIVPTDPATKALFDRIVDAMWLVLSVPTLAAAIQKDNNVINQPEVKIEPAKEIKNEETGVDTPAAN